MKPQKLKWNILSKKQSIDPANIAEEILAVRGFNKPQQKNFLQPDYQKHLDDPLLLPQIKKAITRLDQAIVKQQKIVVYGDYDIDGITASALLYDFLIQLNPNVDIYIPDRFEEGYGLNSEALTKLKDQKVDLVISVDCGVSAIQQIKLAKKINLDLIITDHHEPPTTLPTGAVAIINPKLPNSKYPFSQLAGVGVAFYLVRAMQKVFPQYLEKGQEKWLLDLVALGTVCDVVPIVGENRILVYYGLQVLRRSRRVGLQALADISSTELSKISETDLGFRLGPRLNAAGRLKHAKTALQLLITKDSKQAKKLALKLDELNYERQQQTHTIFNQADQQAKSQKQNLILVLSHKDWSSGVIGIVASKIAEKWHKPCILFAIKEDLAKGSARSYGNFSIINAINAAKSELIQYGGHDFAAGMTIKSENISIFSHKINQYALANIDISSLIPKLDIDLQVDFLEPEISVVNNLEQLRPYGNENNPPVFASMFKLQDFRFIGQNNNHLKFKLISNSGTFVDGIAFNAAHKWPSLVINETYIFAYFLQKNVWQDIEKVQIEVLDIKLNKNK